MARKVKPQDKEDKGMSAKSMKADIKEDKRELAAMRKGGKKKGK